jgi:hypothetical protein
MVVPVSVWFFATSLDFWNEFSRGRKIEKKWPSTKSGNIQCCIVNIHIE